MKTRDGKTWREALRDGALSGTASSLTSTLALSACGRCENDDAMAPTNAISHWLWGERAAHQDGPSARYTLLGYAIHHASATLWSVIYEKYFGRYGERRTLAPAAAGAAAVAALACLVDYTVTPPRLRPGFEKRLSRPSLVLIYTSFGAGLLLRGLLAPRTSAPAPSFPVASRRWN